MMDLSAIKFTVDTSELELASKKILDLRDATEGLVKTTDTLNKKALEQAKTQAQTTKILAQAEKESADASLTREKSQKIFLENTIRADKEDNKRAKTIGNVSTALKDATVSQLGFVDSIERKRDLISEGWTRGEANILKTAESIGVAGAELTRLKSLLSDVQGLISDPFDNSIGPLRAIQKEYEGLIVRSRLVSEGIELSNTQLKQYAMLAGHAAVAVKKMGFDDITQGEGLTQYNKLLEESQVKYIEVAVAGKALRDGEKDLAKQHRDTASAKAFLVKEDERIISVTEQLNTGTLRSISISEKAANATANYARQLRLAGVSGDEATKRLDNYSKKQQLIMQQEEQRVASNLARALQPQVTDVAVSLWSGQNPFTVLLQQGGQVVDLFKQSGIEANKLSATMQASMKGMLPSIIAVGGAVGDLAWSGITGLGKAINGAASNLIGFSTGLDFFTKKLEIMGMTTSGFTKAIAGIGIALNAVSGILAVTGVGALIAMTAGLISVIKQEDNLAKQLALTGGSLGLTHQAAVDYASSMKQVGVSTSSAIDIMAAMSKEGGFVTKEINLVTKAAVDMKTYAGIAIEDTVKSFAKMKEKPVEALVDLAKSTGMVSPAIIQLVMDLEQQGKQAEAVALSMQTLSNVNKAQVEQMKQDYSDFAVFMKSLSTSISNFFSDVFKDLWYKASPKQALEKQLADVRTKIKELDDVANSNESFFGVTINNSKLLGPLREAELSYERQIASLKAADVAASELKETQSATASALGRVNANESKFRTQEQKRTEELSKEQADYQKLIEAGLRTQEDWLKQKKNIEDKYKDKKTPKSQTEKDQEKQQKYYNSLIEKANDLTVKYQGKIEDLSESKRILRDLENDDAFKSLPATMQAKVRAAFDQAEAEGIIADTLKLQRAQLQKVTEEYNKLTAARDKAVFDSAEKQQEVTVAIREESEALTLQASLIGKTDEERKRALKTKEAQVLLDKELLRISTLDATNNEAWVNEQKATAYKQYADRIKNINKEIAVDNATQFKSELDKLSSDIGGIITDALFKGGKDGAIKIRSAIVAKLLEPVNLVVNAVVNTLLGSAVGALTGGNEVGQVMSGINTIGTAGKLGTSALGYLGLSGATTAGIAANTSIGIAAGLTAAEASAAAGAAGAAAAGSTIGQAINMAFDPVTLGIALLIGALASLDDSGTFHTGGAGAYSAKTGSVYGTSVEKQLDFNLEGYTAQATMETSAAISKSIATMLDQTAGTFGKQAGYYAATAFADDTSEDGAWGALMIKLGDTIVTDWAKGVDKWPGREFGDAEQGVKDYAKALALDVRTVLDNMGLPSWAKTLLNNLGDAPSIEQLDQVVININHIQKAIEYFGDTLGYTVDNVTELVNIFGDASTAMQSMTKFYENFYPEQERVSILTRQMTTAFSNLGKELPKSREAFRAMVDSAVAAGDSRLVANLLLLQDGIITLNPVIETAVGSIDDLKSAYDGLSSFYTKLVDDLKSVGTTLTDYLKSLRLGSLSISTPLEKYATAKAGYEQTVLGSKTASTDEARLEALRKLPEASTAFLEASRLVYGSSMQYNQDFSAVEQSIGTAVTDNEYQITIAENSLSELKKAVIGIEGINDAVLGVKETFDKALLDYLVSNGADKVNTSAVESVINTAYQTLFGRQADTSGLEWWSNALKTGAVNEKDLYGSLLAGASPTDISANTNLMLASNPSITGVQGSADMQVFFTTLIDKITSLEATIAETAIANIAATDNNTDVIAQVITNTAATSSYTDSLVERTVIK